MQILADLVLFWLILAASIGTAIGWFVRGTGEARWKRAVVSHSREVSTVAQGETDRLGEEKARLRARLEAMEEQHRLSETRVQELELELTQAAATANAFRDGEASLDHVVDNLDATLEIDSKLDFLRAQPGAAEIGAEMERDMPAAVAVATAAVTKEHQAEAERLQEVIDNLESRLRAGEETLQSMQSVVKEKSEEAARGRGEADQALTRLEEAQELLDRRAAAVARMESEIGQLEGRLQDREEELSGLRTSLSDKNAAVACAEGEFQLSRTQLAQLEAATEERQREVEALEERSVDLQQRLEERDEQIGSLERALEEARAVRPAEDRAESRTAELAEQLQEKDQRITALEAALSESNRSADQAEELTVELRSAQVRSAGLREALVEKNQRISALEVALSESARATEQAAGVEADRRGEEFKELEEQLQTRQNRLARFEETVAELQSELRCSESRLAELQSAHEESVASGETVNALESRIEQLGLQLGEREETATALETAVADLNTTLVERKQHIASLEGRLALRVEAERAMQEELASLRQAATEQACDQAERADLARRLEEGEANVERLESLLGAARTEQATTQEAMQQIRAELEGRVAQLSRDHSDCEKTLSAMAPTWLMSTTRRRKTDALQEIAGLGAVLEERLNELGVFYYRQLAKADARDIEWIAGKVGIPSSRIARDRWVSQAKSLHRKQQRQA